MSRRLSFVFILLCSSITLAARVVPSIIVTKPTIHEHSLSGGPQSIITHAQINTTGVSGLGQALHHLGGVQLQDMTGNGSQTLVSMRGFGANAGSNTLLLVNGIPLTNPDIAPPDLNAIPVQNIKYIEVIAGSESVLYGDQAVGGVINIVTYEKSSDHLNLSCDAGSYDARDCRFDLSNHFQTTTYTLSGTVSRTNNYRAHNDYEQNLLLGSLLFPYSSGSIALDFKTAAENMQYPGALTEAQVHQNRRQASNNTDFFKDTSLFLHLHHKQQLPSDWLLETDFANRNMSGNGVLSIPFSQKRNTYFIRPVLRGKSYHTSIMTGLDLQADQYQLNSAFGRTDDTQQKYGLFGLLNAPIASRLILSAGARGAMQDSRLSSTTVSHYINRALTTTIGLTYQLTPEAALYIRRAGSFRFPKADENASTTNGQPLRTQRGMAYETGAEWQHEQYTAKLNLYQLTLKDEIAFDPFQTSEQPFGSNRNLAPTIRRGASLSGRDQLLSWLTADGQLTAVSARYQHGIYAGNRIPLVSQALLHAGMDIHPLEHWNVYMEGVFTGNQYPANDDANAAGQIGGYTIYNLNIRYHIKRVSAAFHINNIFNQYYYFYTVIQPGLPGEFFYPAPGRNFLFTISYDIA